MDQNQKIEQQNEAIANLVLEVAAAVQRAGMFEQQAKSYAAAVQAEQNRYEALAQELAAAKAAIPAQTGMPFMYGIMGPDGKAYYEECCVDPTPEALYSVVNALNDSPDTGYKVVPMFAAPVAAPAKNFEVVKVGFGFEVRLDGRPVAYGYAESDMQLVAANWSSASTAPRVPDSIEEEEEPDEEPEHDVAVLLRSRLPVTDGNYVHFVLTKKMHCDTIAEQNDHDRFLYEEHTCPTNWLGIKYIIDGTDKDPHSFFQHVQSIEIPMNEWGTYRVNMDDFDIAELFNKFQPRDREYGEMDDVDEAEQFIRKLADHMFDLGVARGQSGMTIGDGYALEAMIDSITFTARGYDIEQVRFNGEPLAKVLKCIKTPAPAASVQPVAIFEGWKDSGDSLRPLVKVVGQLKAGDALYAGSQPDSGRDAALVNAAIDRLIKAWAKCNANDHDIQQERITAKADLLSMFAANPASVAQPIDDELRKCLNDQRSEQKDAPPNITASGGGLEPAGKWNVDNTVMQDSSLTGMDDTKRMDWLSNKTHFDDDGPDHQLLSIDLAFWGPKKMNLREWVDTEIIATMSGAEK